MEAQVLSRVLTKAAVIMVTKVPRSMMKPYTRWADSVENALSIARE